MRVDRGEKDVELAEKPGGRRDAGEREHEDAERQGETGLRAAEPGEIGEQVAGFRIDDDDLEDLKTVRDAVDYVVAKLGNAS